MTQPKRESTARRKRGRARHAPLEIAREAVGVVAWSWVPQTGRTRWFGDLSPLLGMAPQSFSGHYRDYLACLHAEDRERAKQTYVECLRGRIPVYRSDERVVWPDGSVHWLETYGRAEYGQDGRARRLFGAVLDATRRKTEQMALERSQKKYAAVFATSPDAIAIARQSDGLHLEVNDTWSAFTGHAREAAVGRTALELGLWADAADRERVLERFAKTGALANETARFVRADGIAIDALLSAARITLDGVPCMLWTWRDVTENRRIQERERQSRDKYTALFETSPEGIVVTRLRDGVVVEANDEACRQMVITREAARGRSVLELGLGAESPERERIVERLRHSGRIVNHATRFRRYDGTWMDILLSAVRMPLDSEPCVLWCWRDVTDLRRSEDRILELATLDALTGLPNRALLADRLEQALGAAERDSSVLAVMFAGLDRFKTVNDSLGHETGDAVLREAARRLRTLLRREDTVARHGGDHFVILAPELARAAEVAVIAEKILQALRASFPADPAELALSASVGVALFPGDGRDGATLLRNAEAAMNHAKADGRDRFHLFAPDMNASAHRRLGIEAGLRGAIERGELLLHFHPQIDLASGALAGFEALLRWSRPGVPDVPPSQFIPIAEDSGIIDAIGAWALRQACATAAAWNRPPAAQLRVAVNVSVRQLRDPRFVGIVGAALEESGLDPGCLELEVTESMVMHEPAKVIATLTALNAMGVHLAVDDFGTGYSSLHYLKRLPIDKLKIDQSFVRDVPRSVDDRAIVNAIVAMAQNLNLAVTAEGVETAAQLDFLRQLRCDYGQGFYFSAPLPAEAAQAYIAAGARSAEVRAPALQPSA